MTVLDKLASAQGRGDEVPNQALAQEIAARGDRAAVRELVEHLSNADKAISSDCIKVLYEVGGIQPDLIAGYAAAFIKLLSSRNNRLVWGAMTALGAIAERQAADIWQQIDVIIKATDEGSAITQDWGIRVLAAVAAHDTTYAARIFPYLIDFLRHCPPKDLPRHAESTLVAVNGVNKGEFLAAQVKRLETLIRKIKAL